MIIGKPDYSSQNKNHIYPLGSIRPHHFPEAGKMVPSFNSIKVRLRPTSTYGEKPLLPGISGSKDTKNTPYNTQTYNN